MSQDACNAVCVHVQAWLPRGRVGLWQFPLDTQHSILRPESSSRSRGETHNLIMFLSQFSEISGTLLEPLSLAIEMRYGILG